MGGAGGWLSEMAGNPYGDPFSVNVRVGLGAAWKGCFACSGILDVC